MTCLTHKPPTDCPRVAIVGAGVIGLGVGWRLAQAGCSVDIYDKGAAGRGATWAAAGMLAAGAEVEPGEEKLFALNRRSQLMWPDFAAEVEDGAGIPIGYRAEGTLVVATNRDELRQLQFTFDVQRRFGVESRQVSAVEARTMEPYLRGSVAGGIFCPEDHQVDNRPLVEALAKLAAGAGVRVHEHMPVRSIVIEGGRAVGLDLGEAFQPADVVLLAAGPWSREIGGLPPEILPPVRPIKGQMLALQMDPAEPLVRHVLWAPKIYLVPRNDGRLIVGATVEERGFDTNMTAGGLLALLEAAWRAVPGIEELPVVEMWAGFRPGCRDDAPILGPSGVDGLVYATGHHRNGILLAPLTIDLVSRMILTGETPEPLLPFGLDRFQGGRRTVPATALNSAPETAPA
ncbi:glycine oxidase [Constrictibacter sp. MBR-5]|jgi:glycine oxidase|uniref:glycine oxidase ThiO n=1 Tax=Constrictibacter sp. MBR-5 TaxID=3156467 RepID=UPI003399BC4C